jgi:hypothetical protein
MKKLFLLLILILVSVSAFANNNEDTKITNSISIGVGFQENDFYLLQKSYYFSGPFVYIYKEMPILKSRNLSTMARFDLSSPTIEIQNLDDIDNITYDYIEPFNNQIFNENYLGLKCTFQVMKNTMVSFGTGLLTNMAYFNFNNIDYLNINFGTFLQTEIKQKVSDHFYINYETCAKEAYYNLGFSDSYTNLINSDFTSFGYDVSINLSYIF